VTQLQTDLVGLLGLVVWFILYMLPILVHVSCGTINNACLWNPIILRVRRNGFHLLLILLKLLLILVPLWKILKLSAKFPMRWVSLIKVSMLIWIRLNIWILRLCLHRIHCISHVNSSSCQKTCSGFVQVWLVWLLTGNGLVILRIVYILTCSLIIWTHHSNHITTFSIIWISKTWTSLDVFLVVVLVINLAILHDLRLLQCRIWIRDIL